MGSSTGQEEHSSQHWGLKGKGNLLLWLCPEHQGLRTCRTSGIYVDYIPLFCDSACKDLKTAEPMDTHLKEPIFQKLMEFYLH